MVQPDESRIAILAVEIGPVSRKNVSVEIDLQIEAMTNE
jgi:hypothetical protein